MERFIVRQKFSNKYTEDVWEGEGIYEGRVIFDFLVDYVTDDVSLWDNKGKCILARENGWVVANACG